MKRTSASTSDSFKAMHPAIGVTPERIFTQPVSPNHSSARPSLCWEDSIMGKWTSRSTTSDSRAKWPRILINILTQTSNSASRVLTAD